jgi:RNA polymerase II subunit A C-terminal domain phosphatase
MLLRLPPDLHYPIVLLRIEKQVGEQIKKSEALFRYEYTSKVKQGSRYDDEEIEVEKKFVTPFYSSLDGYISKWLVWPPDEIRGPVDVCELVEECPHTIQFAGLCGACGRDMTTVTAGTGSSDIERAPIRMTHDTTYLTISKEEAENIDVETKKRLLASRKLILVVDLDQTIVHAAVEATIGEWQKDKDNPNYEAVKDVRSFQLLDDGPGGRGCTYYIKLRPGLAEFLETISHMYELHIYTMGTRNYALQIAALIDPDHKYFGDRILSRDESGSMNIKYLDRLFPVDTKMVVIIDDRGDVWKWNANLIRVIPYDFYVGLGDINSSFLPKKEEIRTTPDKAEQSATKEVADNADPSKPVEVKVNGADEEATATVEDGKAAVEQLIANVANADPAVREEATKGQEEIISTQLEDKPLLKMQKEQDKKDEAEAAASATPTSKGDSTQATTPTESDSDSSESSISSNSKPKPRHSILKNDDEELIHLEGSLTAVHTAFFKEWDKKRLSGKGGRVSALAGGRKAPLPTASEEDAPNDLSLIPDVKRVMPSMKQKVLAGVTIVFSGVLPLGTDVHAADISIWAKTFGATVTDKVTRDVTHLIAARAGTAKVKQAVKRGIKVVGTPWLIESLRRWRRLDEKPYLLEGAEDPSKMDGTTSDPGDALDHAIHQDFMLSSSDESTGLDTDNEGPARKKTKLEISVSKPDDDDDDDENTKSPLTLGQQDWADIDAELKEFLGSDAESESDAESVQSSLSHRGKRKRGSNEVRSDVATMGSGSRLKAVANISSEQSTAENTPTAQDEDKAIEKAQMVAEAADRQEQADESDSDDELARELERELEEAEAFNN